MGVVNFLKAYVYELYKRVHMGDTLNSFEIQNSIWRTLHVNICQAEFRGRHSKIKMNYLGGALPLSHTVHSVNDNTQNEKCAIVFSCKSMK